jgi:hypothetical protein
VNKNEGSAAVLTGGCLCGAVRYRIDAQPLGTRYCWCRVCQYLAAGNASVNVRVPVRALQVEGQATDYASVADSGNRMHRQFCPTCGTQLFSSSEAIAEVVVVRAGTLDDPQAVQPSMHIWTASAPRWACIDASLPSTPGQPAAATRA